MGGIRGILWGTLGGLFALYAFIGVLITIVRQGVESERQVKTALEAVARGHAMDQASRRASIFAVAEAAHERATRIRQAFSSENRPLMLYQEYDKSIVDGIVEALNRLPVHELASSKGVLAILAIRDQFVFLGRSLEEYLAGPGKHPQMHEALSVYGNSAEEQKQRRELMETGRAVLKRNVFVHLDPIDLRFCEISEIGCR